MWTIEWDITATWTIIRMDGCSIVHGYSLSFFLPRVVLCRRRERVNILHSFPMRCVSNAGQCNNWRGQQPKQKERGGRGESVSLGKIKSPSLSRGIIRPPKTIFQANFSPSSSSSSAWPWPAVMRAGETDVGVRGSRKTFWGSNLKRRLSVRQ